MLLCRQPVITASTSIAMLALVTLGLGACSFDGGGPGILGPSKPDLGPVLDHGTTPDTKEPCRDEDCTPFKCHSVENRCERLLPSNFDPKPVYEGAIADPVLDSANEVLIDTTYGTVEVDGELLDQRTHLVSQLGSGAPPARLLAVNSLQITAGTKVKVSGKYGLIIYARDSISVAGTIDASAHGAVPGPGGRPGGVGDRNSDYLDDGEACGLSSDSYGGEGGGGHRTVDISELTNDGGGGGGGWGSPGAQGGDGGPCNWPIYGAPVIAVAIRGGGGEAVAQNSSYRLSPLMGGCGGGAGGGPDEAGIVFAYDGVGGNGGGGGGALQLSAGRQISLNGPVLAGGGGGERGGEFAGGGGGGSGGSILIEAPTLQITNVLAANGGGGGGGGSAVTVPTILRPSSAEDGGMSNAAALGGKFASSAVVLFGANGGDGASVDFTPTAGSGGVGKCNAGGGGGGLGRILLITGNNINLDNVGSSPKAAVHYEIQTW